MTNPPNEYWANNGDGPLTCFSWRPSLKRIEIQRIRMPYELWDDEYTIQLAINNMGHYSVITKNIKNGRQGFCTHIGKNDHVIANLNNVKILGRNDFPEKAIIRLNDLL
jgi:hypothetical protein